MYGKDTHVNMNMWIIDFLFVIRDPLARILSSFNYERPDMTKDDPFSSKVNTQGLYQECNFWTLEELAQKGLMNTNKDKI